MYYLGGGMVAAGEERDRPGKSSRTIDNPDLRLYKNQFFIMHQLQFYRKAQ